MRLHSLSDSSLIWPILTLAPANPQLSAQIEIRLLSQLLWSWSERPDAGYVFGGNTTFQLTTGQNCQPIAAWVSHDRWQRRQVDPDNDQPLICPDFVVELRRRSDRFQAMNLKMESYLREPGIQLGWLIDCEQRSLCIYRPEQPVLCLSEPELVSTAPVISEAVLPGFVVDWRSLFAD
jgi:Uma2 family endonuclease